MPRLVSAVTCLAGDEVGTNSWTAPAFKFFVQFTFYTALYCAVIVVAAVISLQSRVRNEDGIDGTVIGALAIAGLFGLFALTMTLTSMRYIFINLTTVDYLKSKNVVHQLAIRVPQGTPSGQNYNVITYPLPNSTNGSETGSPRDQLATRTFAVVRTEMGENPWDLGYYRNWKSVMGDNLIDWLFPFNESPCAKHEDDESFYELGPLYHQLRARFGLPEVPAGKGAGAGPETRPETEPGTGEMTEHAGQNNKPGMNGARD